MRKRHNLLALGEGFTSEFKRSGTLNLGREICAFANATGGVILIGVSDAGEIVEVRNHNRLKSEVQAIARSAEPPIAVEIALLHRMDAVEHIGSGIRRVRNLCREYGVAEPHIEVSEHWFTVSFSRPELPEDSKAEPALDQAEAQEARTTQSADPVVRLLRELEHGEKSAGELRNALNLSHRPTFRSNYLHPVLQNGLIELTIPEKPTSSKQRYRLTDKGKQRLKGGEE